MNSPTCFIDKSPLSGRHNKKPCEKKNPIYMYSVKNNQWQS